MEQFIMVLEEQHNSVGLEIGVLNKQYIWRQEVQCGLIIKDLDQLKGMKHFNWIQEATSYFRVFLEIAQMSNLSMK